MIRNKPYEAKGTGLVQLVTTPIGNIDDITIRALNALKEADIIAAEDTRNTGLLLSRYQIKPKKLIPLYAQTEIEQAKKLVSEVKEKGYKACYCSDAGMPGISDPGALLVQECQRQGVPVTLLPGPSACLTGLVLSGFNTADFTFFGFPPTKPGALKSFFESLRGRKETLIFYESPKRLIKTLTAIEEVFGEEKQVALIRELTKVHEEVLKGSVKELLSSPFEERGECILVLEGEEEIDRSNEDVDSLLNAILERGGSLSDCAKEASKVLSIPRKEAYELLLKQKDKR